MSKHLQFQRMPRTARSRIWLAVMLAAGISCDAMAGIGTDSSLGKPAQILIGPSYLIPETLGKLSGNNLFHSFQTFNILTGESANFTTTTFGIANVISRVTGGSLSQINGQIKLTPVSGAPNFFFINPAGVTFGAGASINVPGAFHISTADYVKFPDGNFYADTTKASTFSSAAPEAFGFLGTSRASITVKDGAVLIAKSSKTISIVAGDVEANNASVATQGSGIRVGALGKKAQEVGFTGALPVAEGNLIIRNGASISSSSLGAVSGEIMELSAGTISIDSQGNSTRTGIFSNAVAGSTSNTMDVDVMASESLSITNSGRIRSTTTSSGNAGAVKISVGNINIDGTGASFLTGIWSETTGTGGANQVEIAATGNLSVNNGAGVFSDNATSSNTSLSSVKVSAANISIDGKENPIGTGIYADSKLSAGNVDVSTQGQLSIGNAGVVSSNLYSSGRSGSITVNAGSIAIDAQGSNFTTGIYAPTGASAGSSRMSVTAANSLSIRGGGRIYSQGSSSGVAVPITVVAGNITIDGPNGIFSDTKSSIGNAGNIDVTTAGSLLITQGSKISTISNSSGIAGNITVTARDITIDPQGNSSLTTGIVSNAKNTGSAGNVDVTAQGDLRLTFGGEIYSNTWSSGNAGAVTVNAGNITTGIVEGSYNSGLGVGGGIYSKAWQGSSGNANNVTVTANGNVSVFNDSEITSGASIGATGKTGNILVSMDGNLSITNGGQIRSISYSPYDAGTVTVRADNIAIDAVNPLAKTGVYSESYLTGNGGDVDIRATRNLTLANGGSISSAAFSGSGNAGAVNVSAGSISVSKRAAILTSTYSSGDAGVLNISADSITLDGGHFLNQAESGSSGNAGEISLTAKGLLSLANGGWISSATRSSGSAGTVLISAGTLLVEGASSSIKASATRVSSGQTGSVAVNAADGITLANGGQLSIQNDATVAAPLILTPTSINVTAPRIAILNSPNAITTSSTGNIAAGNIKIVASDKIFLDPSGITTTSNLGSGGAIDITAGMLRLDNSQIATSVTGLTGNGGNIAINANTLILNTGFIQANTAAANASGGTVSIAAQNLVSSGNMLFLGGNTPYTYLSGVFGFNVIQAAAPTGVSGAVQTTSPSLDISGSLIGLNTQVIDTGGLGRSPCQITGGSSLAKSGRGGLPSSATDLLSAEPNILPNKTVYFSPTNGHGKYATSDNESRLALSNRSCS